MVKYFSPNLLVSIPFWQFLSVELRFFVFEKLWIKNNRSQSQIKIPKQQIVENFSFFFKINYQENKFQKSCCNTEKKNREMRDERKNYRGQF